MANVTTQSVVRQIESLYGGASIAGLSDRELVERFVMRRDTDGEDAFAALVARHGPMVLGLCRVLLRNRQDAEDAFQAVFLAHVPHLRGRTRAQVLIFQGRLPQWGQKA
jgi:Sigma-70 region 2